MHPLTILLRKCKSCHHPVRMCKSLIHPLRMWFLLAIRSIQVCHFTKAAIMLSHADSIPRYLRWLRIAQIIKVLGSEFKLARLKCFNASNHIGCLTCAQLVKVSGLEFMLAHLKWSNVSNDIPDQWHHDLRSVLVHNMQKSQVSSLCWLV